MKENYKKSYCFLRAIIGFFFKIIYRPTIVGKENIPTSGPVVIAGNHTNDLDAFLICISTKRMVHFLSKKELHEGHLSLFFKLVGSIPVDRNIHDKNAKNKAVDELIKGRVIGIFPEGTINRTKDIILPFKYGAVSMAQKSGASIVPFSVTGKFKVFKGNIKITFEKSFKVGNYSLENANKLLESTIKESLINNK
ncbi:MAG: 1-acyl-sn-glycerol-3-phosphate acyltransferase [Bacilli bacterium]